MEINFRNIVKYAEQNRMKKELRILELFMLIITLAHFFVSFLFYLGSHAFQYDLLQPLKWHNLDKKILA